MRHKLTVHTGPMFSGKSLQVLAEWDKCRLAKQNAITFRPKVDTRNPEPFITTRFNNNCVEGIPAVLVGQSEDIIRTIVGGERVACVLIDEGEMFDVELPYVVRRLLENSDVMVAGLDLDYRGWPFPVMSALCGLATTVHKHLAICDVCASREARFTQRLVNDHPASAFAATVVPEGQQEGVIYQARCANCFQPPTDFYEWLRCSHSH